MRKIVLLALLCLFYSVGVSADIIKLKSGEIIEGEIVKETDIFVRIDTFVNVDGRVQSFLLDQIESIDHKEYTGPRTRVEADLQQLLEEPDDIQEKTAEEIRKQELREVIPEDLIFFEKTLPKEGIKLDNEGITQMIMERSPEESAYIDQEAFEKQAQDFLQSKEIKTFIRTASTIMILVLLFVIGFFALIGFLIARTLDKDLVDFQPCIGFWRRFLALLIDMQLGPAVILFFIFLPGIFISLDSSKGIWLLFLLMIPLQLVFFWYFFLGYSKLKNTYGRYVMKIRVVDKGTENKPSLKQAFKRSFLLGLLWPIEGFIIIFTRTKRRVGDRWANTDVRPYDVNVPWFLRIIPGILIFVVCFGSIYLASPLINNRMTIAQPAKAFVESKFGSQVAGYPRRIEIAGHQGYVTFKLKNGENIAVYLYRTDAGWSVDSADNISDEELGWGMNVSY